jgi:hypothetical protein
VPARSQGEFCSHNFPGGRSSLPITDNRESSAAILLKPNKKTENSCLDPQKQKKIFVAYKQTALFITPTSWYADKQQAGKTCRYKVRRFSKDAAQRIQLPVLS